MKLKVTQLRRIIRETLETTNDARIRAAFDTIYMEQGSVSLEELEAALMMAPGTIKPVQLQLAGLQLEDDDGIVYVTDY
jgi:hypothetical protein